MKEKELEKLKKEAQHLQNKHSSLAFDLFLIFTYTFIISS
jgi:hypothetical protein